MQYALINNKPVRAGDVPPGKDPDNARCPYCGGLVKLTLFDPQACVWVHYDRAAETACDAARAKEQAELYAVLGGGQ